MRTSKLEGFGETMYITAKNIQEGQKISGKFKKRFEKEAKGPSGKFKSVTYYVETEGGSVGINKIGNLGYLMDERLKVQEGENVEIEYRGRDENDYHNFDVTVID